MGTSLYCLAALTAQDEDLARRVYSYFIFQLRQPEDAERLTRLSFERVWLQGSDLGSIKVAARELRSLSADPDTPSRCREVARRRFSLNHGVEAYLRLYRRLAEQ